MRPEVRVQTLPCRSQAATPRPTPIGGPGASTLAGVIATAVVAYLPSPPSNGVSLGPVRLHVYGLLIAGGIVAAVWLSQRRWEKIGGAPGTMATLALWGVPGGLIGARLYSVATSWQDDTGGHWYRAFEIWRGGLGIWGGVIGGI